MQFDKIPVAYLQKLTGQTRTQEQTLEVRLPDGMPDIGRVLGAWGQVIIRGKEWNTDHMAVSCGVMAWVLYTPEGEEGVRSVEAWLPFSMKWELPETRHDGKILTACLLKGIDARSTSARKLMIRATVSALGEAWQQAQAEYATPGEISADVEMRTVTYPMLLPKEMGEKAFNIEEQVSLPGPQMEKILYYSLQPEILDQKVMGDKVVFRGAAVLHLLFRSEDGSLHTYDCDLPFSQFAELEDTYEQDPEVMVCAGVTALDLAPDAEGMLQLKAGVVGQYTLCDREMITVVADAYSPCRPVTPVYETLNLPAILDATTQTLSAEITPQADVQQVVDVSFCPGYPVYSDSDLQGWFQMLYTDTEGQLHSLSAPWEGDWEWPADRSNVDICITPLGRPSVTIGAGAVTLRGEMQLNAVAIGGEGITMITGLALGEQEKPDPDRPSLILCRKGNRCLWDVAKQNGTTVAKIMQANQLEGEPADDAVLLIPVS